MNYAEVERHLAKAQSYLAKGEAWYRKAGEEIELAREAGATWPQIGDRLDRSKSWCQRVSEWAKSPANGGSPDTPIDWKRGSHGTTAEIQAGARKLLAEAPMEQVERIIETLPKERKQAVAAAAGHQYSKLREEMEERERNLTPAQHKEREAAGATIDTHVGRVMAPFSSLSIANHLEQATDLLKEMVEGHAVSPEVMTAIDTALAAFLDEYKVAQAMVGTEAGA